MSYLKRKSEFNDEAAQLLFDKSLYAPSIHCAYYSCFQLIKHIIQDKLGVSFKAQDKEIRAFNTTAHVYALSKIKKKVKEVDRPGFIFVNRRLGDLREFRINSDYNDLQIDSELSEKAIRYARDLNSYFINKLL